MIVVNVLSNEIFIDFLIKIWRKVKKLNSEWFTKYGNYIVLQHFIIS